MTTLGEEDLKAILGANYVEKSVRDAIEARKPKKLTLFARLQKLWK